MQSLTDDVADPPADLTFYHTVEFGPGRWTAGWPAVVPIVDMIVDTMATLDFAASECSTSAVVTVRCRSRRNG